MLEFLPFTRGGLRLFNFPSNESFKLPALILARDAFTFTLLLFPTFDKFLLLVNVTL